MKELSQKELLNLFGEFTSDGKKIKPTLTNDWTFQTTYGYNTSYINLHSENLSQSILKIDSNLFLNFIISENIEIKGNKIIGTFAISSKRNLEREEIYNKYLSCKEETESKEILKSELIAGKEYKTVQKQKILFLGKRYIQSIIIKNTLTLSKIKKAYMAYNFDKKKLVELNEKDIIIEEVSDRKGIEHVNEVIKNNILKSKFIFIKEFMPKAEELNYILVKGKGINDYYKNLKIKDKICYLRVSYNEYLKFEYQDSYKNFNLTNSNVEYTGYRDNILNSMEREPNYTISIENNI